MTQAKTKSIPRGAKVKFVLSKNEKGFSATMITVEPTPDADVEAVSDSLRSLCDTMEIDEESRPGPMRISEGTDIAEQS